MSEGSSKRQVQEYLKKTSKGMSFEQLAMFTTMCISQTLHLSRSLTSQYLNELVKEGTVIKISSRPVYYFDRIQLEKKYHIAFSKLDFLSIKELIQTLQQDSPLLRDFEKAIGHEGSLQYSIAQIKSAVLYPDGGLPVLLYGEKGGGKSYLVRLAHEFCLNHGLLNKHADLHTMKVLKTDDSRMHKRELFGYFDEKEQLVKKGKLEEAAGGILFIQDVDCFHEDCQELLADFINTRKFSRADNDTYFIESDARVMMSCQGNPQSLLSPNLVLHIPVICKIPSLMDRNDDEKKRFIIKFFKEEAERIDLPIYIPEKLLILLMDYNFENNINELKKSIRSIVAKAYAESNAQETCHVYMYHLPVDLLSAVNVEESQGEPDLMLRIDTLEANEDNNRILYMWNQFLEAYEKNRGSLRSFVEEGQKTIRHYYDILIFQESYSDIRLAAIEKIVLDIIKTIKNARNINLPINCGYVLTRMILSYQKSYAGFRQWENDHKETIKEILTMMKQSMSNEYILSKFILKQIQSHLNITLYEMNQIFLMMNISLYNKDIHSQDTIGIILSHGYSTASSIADAANSLLSTYIFEAIDMPLDTGIDEVNTKLNLFINENRHIKNIILLVDMGSLEEIGTEIANSVNVGVINNISTSLALNIGTKMMQHYELEEILKVACEEAQCRYKVLSVAKKEKAIVFTNDAGVVVSEKLSALFRKSLPKDIELKMMEYDYHELMKNKEQDYLFKKYEVLLMIKPYNLKLSNVKSVTLEEIMNFKDIDKVNQVLKEYLNKEEIEAFDQSLLKNFSLQSVMENLTILNAQKLLDYVSDSMNALQHVMNKKFQSKTIVGIYIHICFLVERLVTKTALDNYRDLRGFVARHQDFIDQVNQSFEAMLTHYHVSLPVIEIAYLYEYLEHDDCRRESNGDF